MRGVCEVHSSALGMFSEAAIAFQTVNIYIFIGYWLDMKIYVRDLVRSYIARRQERNINYAPERVHTFPYPTNNRFITYALAALL